MLSKIYKHVRTSNLCRYGTVVVPHQKGVYPWKIISAYSIQLVSISYNQMEIFAYTPQ